MRRLGKYLGQFLAIVTVFVGVFALIRLEVQHLERTAVPHVKGVLDFYAHVQYPPPATDKTQVEVRMALDSIGNQVITGKPMGANHDYAIHWNTKTTENGEHKIIVLAYYGKALIGEESHTVFVDN
jgi:hypothetical protein